MWCLSLFLVLGLSGVLMADPQEEVEQCAENANFAEMEPIITSHGQLAESALENSCPKILGFMDCVHNVIQREPDVLLVDLPIMAPGRETASQGRVFNNIRSVFTELCQEGSDLNNAYKRNAACLETLQLGNSNCMRNANFAYDVYRGFENRIQEEAGEDTRDDNKPCFLQAYLTACRAAQIHDTCGQESFELFQTVVKRSGIFKLALCSEEGLEKLKTDFLDSLEVNDNHKDLFRLAFDLRKRRK